MTHHPLSELLPCMLPEEYQALKESIKEKGLQVPITRFEGMALDGRHRLKACEELGITPKFKDFEKNGIDETDYIIIHNINRRNLSVSQKACCAVEYIIKGRGNLVGRGKNGFTWRDRASDLFGISQCAIDKCVYVKKRDEKLFQEIKMGSITFHRAYMKCAGDKASPSIFKRLDKMKVQREQNSCLDLLDGKLKEGWEIQMETHKGKWFCHFHGKNGILRSPTLVFGTAYEKISEAIEDKIKEL